MIMDDTIKTSDTNFDGYNPYVPHTSEMMDYTICGVGTGGQQIYDFHIGAPSIDYDRYTVTVDNDGMWNMNKTQENPYDITDTSGNKWSVTKHPDETLTVDKKTNHLWKYNEDKIFKDVEDYVISTYGSHYCGSNEDYEDIQTIDLMAAKKLAANFCQANILKYGSRYGDKDGRNKIDLMKVIHYAMLLLHFDRHYSRQNNGLSEFR